MFFAPRCWLFTYQLSGYACWGVRENCPSSCFPLLYDISHDQRLEEGEAAFIPRQTTRWEGGPKFEYTDGGNCNLAQELPFIRQSPLDTLPTSWTLHPSSPPRVPPTKPASFPALLQPTDIDAKAVFLGLTCLTQQQIFLSLTSKQHHFFLPMTPLTQCHFFLTLILGHFFLSPLLAPHFTAWQHVHNY